MKPVRDYDELKDMYIGDGQWAHRGWVDIFEYNARRWPDEEAFVDARMRVSWAKIKQITDRLALGLIEIGLNRDDVVIGQLPNCIENIALWVACEKAGLVHLYSMPTNREAEIAHFIEFTNAVAAVTCFEFRHFNHYKMFNEFRASGKFPKFEHIFLISGYGLEKLPEDVISVEEIINTPIEEKYTPAYLYKTRGDPFEVWQMVSTTGTTGMPKIGMLSPNCNISTGLEFVNHWRLTRDDIGITAAFCFSGPSEGVIHALVTVAGKIILVDWGDPEEVLKAIERERGTYYGGFPLHSIQMARHHAFDKYNLSSLRFVGHAGAPFPAGLLEEVEDRFGVPLITYYGVNEIQGILGSDVDIPREKRFGSVGRGGRRVHPKIVDDEGNELPRGEVGKLIISGGGVGAGYYNDPEKTKQAFGGTLGKGGWFDTEDLARMDEDGDIWLAGRTRDMILRAGQNIFPAEIEGMLNAHPKVSNVCIVSMPSSDYGEKACAYIILKKGETTFTFLEMVSFLTERKLAKYKLPERLEIVESFPMLGDKIHKMALGKDIANKLLTEGLITQSMIDKFIEQGKIL
ncbi:MAG: AMP-binding protein [Proteobacteria bacterium]|nr:AMP-binding protein [Pseudomonadota bacterium]